MSEPKADAPEPSAASPAPRWRFAAGVVLFAIGLISPVFVPLVARLPLGSGATTAISGLLVFGIPEVLWLAAAAVMGKEGFDRLKQRLFGWLRAFAPADRVSRTRYRVGLVMFTLPLVLGLAQPYAEVWWPEVGQTRLEFVGALDVMWFASFFVLGGDFWDKLRALFVHDARVSTG